MSSCCTILQHLGARFTCSSHGRGPYKMSVSPTPPFRAVPWGTHQWLSVILPRSPMGSQEFHGLTVSFLTSQIFCPQMTYLRFSCAWFLMIHSAISRPDCVAICG